MKIEGYYVQLFFVLLGSFGNGLCLMVTNMQQLYSYASQMVQNFGLAHSRDTTGHYTGLMTCALMLGRALSSPFWGYMIDNWGRKPVILIAVFATGVLSVAFGFVVDYAMAVVLRFLIGLTAPTQIVTKTYVAEVTPPSFLPTATAMYSSSWLLGGVVGFIVGGLLVDPKKSGLITSGFFADWPYLLPNLITAVLSFVTVVGMWIWLDETLKRKDAPLNPASTIPIRSMWRLSQDRTILLLMMLYILNSFVNTSFNELFPLWCWASRVHGGLSFNPSEIGWALAGMSVALAVGNQVCFKWVVKKKGLKWSCLWPTLLMVPLTIALPWVSYSSSTVFIWIYMILLGFVIYLLNYTVLTGQIVLSNNSVIKQERGKLNGLFNITGSAARAAAPLITDNLFAVTTNSGEPFPINYVFTFLFLAGWMLVMWFLTRYVPLTAEKQKETLIKEQVRKTIQGNAAQTKTLTLRNTVRTSSIITEEGYHQFDEDSEEEAEENPEENAEDSDLTETDMNSINPPSKA